MSRDGAKTAPRPLQEGVVALAPDQGIEGLGVAAIALHAAPAGVDGGKAAIASVGQHQIVAMAHDRIVVQREEVGQAGRAHEAQQARRSIPIEADQRMQVDRHGRQPPQELAEQVAHLVDGGRRQVGQERRVGRLGHQFDAPTVLHADA